MPEKEITIEIRNPEIIILLIVLSGILFLILQVGLNSPIVFGDEGYHARLAQLIAEKQEFFVWEPLKTKLLKNNFGRPPYWNLLIASFLYLFGFNEVIIKFLPPFITFLTGLAVFLLGKELYNKKVGFIASIITVTIPSFVTYSILIYTDVLVTLYLTMFFLLFYLSDKRGKKKYLILSGIFGTFAFLTKPSGFVVYIFMFFAFIYELIKKRKFYEPFKKYFILFLVTILFSSTFFLRSLFYYNVPTCTFPYIEKIFDVSGCFKLEFESKFKFTGKAEEVGTEQSVYRMGIMNYLTFAYGNIWFIVFATCCGLFILLSKREKKDIFILLILSTLLIVFPYFTPRAEDAARYSLAWSPFIALMAGRWFSKIYEFIKKYQKYLALIVFIVVIFFSYQNLMDKLSVMEKVKQFSPAFFEACDWIKENTAEDALIATFWGARAMYNCQRNVADPDDLRLSEDIDYMLSVAKEFGVTHIFIQKFSIDPQNKHLAEKYDLNYVERLEAHPEHFNKVYENGPPLEQCLQQGGCDGNTVYEVVY